MFSIIFGLIPGWIKWAVFGAILLGIIGLGGYALYSYRHSIQQAAYDAVFRKQVQAHLDEQEARFKQLEEMNAQKDRALAEQIAAQKLLQQKQDKLEKDFTAQKFKNAPADPGLNYTFDQIRRTEAELEAIRKAQQPKLLGPRAVH